MAKKRIIPKLQIMPSSVYPGRFSLVTTIQFSRVIEVGDPVSQAKIYESQMVDELILIDISKSKNLKSKKFAVDLFKSVSKQVFLPLTIGGGVKNLEDFRLLLSNGADKIVINSGAIKEPKIISDAADKFGSQCVVASIDYKINKDGSGLVFADSGKTGFPYNPLEWAKKLENYGAGEILLTCINNDGKKNGLELNISKLICESLSIPVIVSGGCGLSTHFINGFTHGNFDAVSAGTFFSFQDQNPMQTRSHIKNAGIDIRLYK